MMGLSLFALTLAAPLSGQVTTNCDTQGSQTRCTTDQPVPNAGQQMLDNMARQNRDRAAQQASTQEGAADRRAAAYAQVGDLIAKGDCPAAKRLAAFYGHPDIVKDTARACPN